MKYFLIELTTTEEKVEKAVYEYETRDLAVANFHSKMGAAMKAEAYLAEMLMVIDETGSVQIYDYFKREVPEVEPVEA